MGAFTSSFDAFDAHHVERSMIPGNTKGGGWMEEWPGVTLTHNNYGDSLFRICADTIYIVM